MRLNTMQYPPELTLRQLHLERGDYVLASPLVGDVLVKLCGAAFIIVWRDDKGVAQQIVRTTDAAAFKAAAFVQEHGCAPLERKQAVTRRGMPAIELGKVG